MYVNICKTQISKSIEENRMGIPGTFLYLLYVSGQSLAVEVVEVPRAL